MEPHPLRRAEVRNCRQVVRGPGIHSPRRSHHAHRAISCSPIRRHRVLQIINLHPVTGIHSHSTEAHSPHPHQFRSLLQPAMRLGRTVHPQHGPTLHSRLPQIKSCPRMPSHSQAKQIRHRTSARQQATCPTRHPHQFSQPTEHLLLHHRGRVIESAHIRIHPRCQHLR